MLPPPKPRSHAADYIDPAAQTYVLLQLPLEAGICSLCLYCLYIQASLRIEGDLRLAYFDLLDPAMISLLCNIACKPEGRRNLHHRSPTLAYIHPGFTSSIHSSGRYFAGKCLLVQCRPSSRQFSRTFIASHFYSSPSFASIWLKQRKQTSFWVCS